MADALWGHLQSQFAEPVPSIRRIIGPHSVELENGHILDNIDSIIYCTGYHFNIPDGLIAEEIHPYSNGSVEKPPNLYRNIFPLHRDQLIRNSITFLGQGAFIFPSFVQSELGAMAISPIWKGTLRCHHTIRCSNG
jgi:dimethylaniline monooxygenase (N-oxide forming)